jgi:hypothetical protein
LRDTASGLTRQLVTAVTAGEERTGDKGATSPVAGAPVIRSLPVFKTYSSYASLASLALAVIPLAVIGFKAMATAVSLALSVA